MIREGDNHYMCRNCGADHVRPSSAYRVIDNSPLTGIPASWTDAASYFINTQNLDRRRFIEANSTSTLPTPVNDRTPQQIRDEYSRQMNQNVGRGHRAGRNQPAIQHLRRHQQATLQAIERVVNPPVRVSGNGTLRGMDYSALEWLTQLVSLPSPSWTIRGELNEQMERITETKDKADKPDTTYVSPWLP